MNKGSKQFGYSLLLGVIVPAILFCVVRTRNNEKANYAIQESGTAATAQQRIMREVDVLTDDGVVKMDLQDYLVSVVLREMPASFEKEALKAQAVVARTYTLRRAQAGGKHENATVCTNSACCQGFCSQDEYLSSGGSLALLDKVIGAVAETADEILMYEGELIEATYFSCSGGRTEDAVAVWGSEIPYLQATDSPGEEHASHFADTVSMSVEEFAEKLQLKTSAPADRWIGAISYTDGGGVDKIELAGESYSGTTVRQKLGLRSTAFAISIEGESVTIKTKGYGHRVGMSQYGADAMAMDGKNYAQILAHYYSGAYLTTLTGD